MTRRLISHVIVIAILCIGLCRTKRQKLTDYKYDTGYFTQQVDHFSFTNRDTFNMKYLYNMEYWDRESGPILFYCGNEGPAEIFAENTGLMWDMAPKLKAMVVFAEHRYYGDSQPYGKDAYKDVNHYAYLTTEQALADYATFLTDLKTVVEGAEHSPVIAFGGSYGGQLAAYMRVKYPHIITGALVGGGPVMAFEGASLCGVHRKGITQSFARYGFNCVENIRRSWKTLENFASTNNGQQFIKFTFNICEDIVTLTDLNLLMRRFEDMWETLAMVNYPYPTTFAQNLPAWPIKHVCAELAEPYWDNPDQLMRQLALATQKYFNFSGDYDKPCFKLADSVIDGLNDNDNYGWKFQSCSELINPLCSDGVEDFFAPLNWNLTEYTLDCAKEYNITPRPYWMMTNYVGADNSGLTNVIFSNGELDPWRGSCVQESNPEQNIYAILIPNAAHHLDLRAAHPSDPDDLKSARNTELTIIKRWIRKHWVARNGWVSVNLTEVIRALLDYF